MTQPKMNEDVPWVITYYRPDGSHLFSEEIVAFDYWSACAYAHCDMPKGADDFDLFDPSNPGDAPKIPAVLHVRSVRAHLRSRRYRRQQQEKAVSGQPVN
jgi:hypothetical protein